MNDPCKFSNGYFIHDPVELPCHSHILSISSQYLNHLFTHLNRMSITCNIIRHFRLFIYHHMYESFAIEQNAICLRVEFGWRLPLGTILAISPAER